MTKEDRSLIMDTELDIKKKKKKRKGKPCLISVKQEE